MVRGGRRGEDHDDPLVQSNRSVLIGEAVTMPLSSAIVRGERAPPKREEGPTPSRSRRVIDV